MTHSCSQDILKNVVGSIIVRAQYFIHVSKDSGISVIAAKIIFSEGKFITVKCGSDGESLQIGQEVFEETDLGDAGRLEIVDSNDIDPALLYVCIGRIANRIILESCCEIPKSLCVNCDGQMIFFSNVGDMLNFDEVLFRRMISEEEWPPLATTFFPAD